MTLNIFLKSLLIFVLVWINYSFASINLTVSPIKYEIETSTWSTITKTATLHNRWNNDLNIITWKSDFIAWWTTWSPTFVRYSELVHPDQQLSSWITLSSSWFTIPANSTKEITFTINVPDNATPGWHYWAVFFKNNNSQSSSWSGAAVWINVDYWIIILLEVEWDIITEVVINNDNIIIIWWSSWNNNTWNSNNSNNWWWYSNSSNNNYNLVWDWNNNNLVKKDNCLFDFTNSGYDWKCFDEPKKIIEIIKWEENIVSEENISNNFEENNNTDNNKDEDFNITFKIPVENKWNTHVKTTWKIKLFDEDWNQIKQIWKKIIVNDKWAIIWEQIVNYVPVNDSLWNILPWTKRIFTPEWEWFPVEYRDKEGKIKIKFKTPSEYYSDISSEKDFRLMPWERINYDKQNKKITAKFDLSHLDEEGKEVSFPSAQEFNIEYTRKYVWYNYYFIILVIWTFIWLFISYKLLSFFTKKIFFNKKATKTKEKPKKVIKKSDNKKIKKTPVKKKTTKKSEKTKK